MNQQQVKYVRQRAEKLLLDKKQSLKNKYTVKGIRLSAQEKIDAIKEGRYVVKGNPSGKKDMYASNYWHSHIVFVDEVKDSFDQDAYDKEEKSLKETFDKLMDELMIGDNAEALRLLRQLENI